MSVTYSNAAAEHAIGPLQLCLRSVRFAGLLLLGLVLLPFMPLVGARSRQVVRWWHGRLLAIMNIQPRVCGTLPQEPALIVANHCSWLDIVVLGHVFDAAFISKAEIGGWPLVGAFARAAGTLFLSRGAYKTDETTKQIHAVFETQRNVLLFPEGTTTHALEPQRFHARLFAAAVDEQRPVVPVAIRYSDDQTAAGQHHPMVPWVNSPLWPNFKRVFRLPGLRVDIRVCAPIDSTDYDRRSLAEASHTAICHRQAMAAATPQPRLVP